MRLPFLTAGFIALLACLWTLSAQTSFPHMTTVNPLTAKVGDVITVDGENLDEINVAELFLTCNKGDVKVQITEQSATEIKFKVPDTVDAGRFELVTRTSGTETTPVREFVQPVKLTVE